MMNKKNNTKHVEKELTLFLEGELPDSEHQHIQSHLASCERCGQALRELERLPRVLQAFGEIEPSETMFDEIEAQIAQSSQRRFARRKLAWKIGLQFAFVVLIVCLTLFIEHYFEPKTDAELNNLEVIRLYLKEHEKITQPAVLTRGTEHLSTKTEDLVYSEFLKLFPDFARIQQQIISARSATSRDLLTLPTISEEESLTLEIAQKSAPFNVIAPPYLHPGYILDSIYKIKGKDSLHLVYTNGIDALSLFEQAIRRQSRLKDLNEYVIYQSQQNAETTILVWRDGDTAFALIGVAEMQKLMAIVESIQSD
jgi:hypothetical protein